MIPLRVRARLLLVGWTPWRSVAGQIDLPEQFELFHAASIIIDQFGGIQITGKDNCQIEFSPMACKYAFDEIEYYAEQLGERLYPIADCLEGDNFALVVSESGKCYISFADELRPLSTTFSSALDDLILGRKDNRISEAEMPTIARPRGESPSQ